MNVETTGTGSSRLPTESSSWPMDEALQPAMPGDVAGIVRKPDRGSSRKNRVGKMEGRGMTDPLETLRLHAMWLRTGGLKLVTAEEVCTAIDMLTVDVLLARKAMEK